MNLKLALLLAFVFQCSISNAATVYSNLARPQNWVVQTVVWWDDVQIVGGGTLSKVRFYGQQNSTINNVPKIYTTSIEFHLFDKSTGLPNGLSLGQFQVSSATPMSQGEVRLIESEDLSPLHINIPTNAKLGVAFHQGHNVAVQLFGEPTLGSSANTLWMGSPPVERRESVGRNNIGMQIEVVPEPQSWPLFLIAAVTMATRFRRKRCMQHPAQDHSQPPSRRLTQRCRARPLILARPRNAPRAILCGQNLSARLQSTA